MITIKRKILLEKYRSRRTPLTKLDSIVKVPKGKCKDCGYDEINMQDGSKEINHWGALTASTIPIRLFITHNMDDMGMFSDTSLVGYNSRLSVDYSILEDLRGVSINAVTPLPHTGLTPTQKLYLRSSDKQTTNYYSAVPGITAIGYTNDKIDDVISIKLSEQYKLNKNRADDPKNYWSGIVSLDSNTNPTILTYILNAKNLDPLELSARTNPYGSYNTTTGNAGIRYVTDKNIFRTITDGKCYGCDSTEFKNKIRTIFSTSMVYTTEGWNKYNTGLSAITKNEIFFGITSPQEVMSDVFIDRGVSSPMEHHLRLNDVAGVEEFSRYGNKFYNIITQ